MTSETGTKVVKKPRKRKRLLIAANVQIPLAIRAMIYWLSCVVTVHLIRLFIDGPVRALFGFTTEGDIAAWWVIYGPPFIASIFFVPIILYDILRLTHRFVGPMVRLKISLQKLSRGQEVEPIVFRKGDLWREFADAFNAVQARMDQLEADLEAAREPDAREPEHSVTT